MTTNKTERDAGRSAGRIYTFETLPEKGIRYSSNHIRRLVAKSKFPKPFYMTERRPAWTEATLDEWIAEREAATPIPSVATKRPRRNEK